MTRWTAPSWPPRVRALLAQRADWQLERDYPFSADFLAVCHAWRAPDGHAQVALKGAPETVHAAVRSTWSCAPEIATAAARGLRLLGVAQAPWSEVALEDPTRYPFRWVGFVALADPLRAVGARRGGAVPARRHPRGDDHRRLSRHGASRSRAQAGIDTGAAS